MAEGAADIKTPVVDPANLGFADLARLGKNEWWRYVLSLFLFFVLGVAVFMGIYLLLWLYAGFDPIILTSGNGVEYDTAEGTRRGLILFVFIMFSLISYLLAARIVFPSLHKRAWRSFLTAADRFRYEAFWLSFFAIGGRSRR